MNAKHDITKSTTIKATLGPVELYISCIETPVWSGAWRVSYKCSASVKFATDSYYTNDVNFEVDTFDTKAIISHACRLFDEQFTNQSVAIRALEKDTNT